MPDNTLKQAIQEAYASAPANIVVVHTLELRHPNFRDLLGEPMAVRLVRAHENFRATLEASAPMNAGEEVDFFSLGFEMSLPAVDTAPMPEINVTIDNVTLDLIQNIEAAVDSNEKIELTYRPYLSTDTSGPQMDPPITLYFTDIQATVYNISGKARMIDIGNRAFPKNTFSRKRFPNI